MFVIPAAEGEGHLSGSEARKGMVGRQILDETQREEVNKARRRIDLQSSFKGTTDSRRLSRSYGSPVPDTDASEPLERDRRGGQGWSPEAGSDALLQTDALPQNQGPAQRELLNLSAAIDQLLRGKASGRWT
eukprot:Skav235422  [mRNA]  locus=scaffold924:500736:501633:+ [translate_table: standard]